MTKKELKEKIMAELNKIQSDEDRTNAILKLFSVGDENLLREQVTSCRDDWDENVSDYLYNEEEEFYDINYIVNADGSYKAVRLLLVGGGPSIYLDTNSRCIEGYWYGYDVVSVPLHPNTADAVDEYFEDLFESVR